MGGGGFGNMLVFETVVDCPQSVIQNIPTSILQRYLGINKAFQVLVKYLDAYRRKEIGCLAVIVFGEELFVKGRSASN